MTCYISDNELDAALPGADALILACPLTDRTRHLIGARQLALMHPGAVIVNVARGPVIDEQALAAALGRGCACSAVAAGVAPRVAAAR